MKKLLISLLMLLTASTFGQGNPTLVYGSNGVVLIPATTHAGKVTVALSSNNIGAGKVYTSVDGSRTNFNWTTPSAGVTPSGQSNNVWFTTNGSNIIGSNAWSVIFVGNNPRFTNNVGSGYEWNDNGTGFFSMIGNGSGLTRFQMYRRQDGFGVDDIYNGHSDNTYYNGNRAGLSTFYGANGVVIGVGSNPASTPPTPYLEASNSVLKARVSVNGNGNSISNFANLYPKSFQFSPRSCSNLVGGAIATMIDPLADCNAIYQQPTGASNDTTCVFAYLAARTNYYFHVEHRKANNDGIMTLYWVSGDGVTTNSLGTVDGYNVINAYNQLSTIGPFTIPEPGGRCRFLMKIQTKNASSSNFFWDPSRYWVEAGD